MGTTILFLALGCAYEEVLPEKDIFGKVVLPAEALTYTLPDGSEVTDTRFIGPVFLGAFAGLDETSFNYPHPEMGPIIEADTPGDTFPYGGATIGRYDFACYEALACKVVTGRFTDYNEILEYFGDMLENPVKDSAGAEVAYSSTFQQECFDYFYATSDQEMAFIGEDDFTENADGDYEASFSMPHTVFHEGMTIWGWMDAPVVDVTSTLNNGSFSTCDTNSGREQDAYDQTFFEGRVYYDALNVPSKYIYGGDWVAEASEESVVTLKDDGTGEMIPTEPTVRMSIGIGIEGDE